MTTVKVPHFLLAVMLGASMVVRAASVPTTPVRNIVLVHGANADGSSWRGVYDILKNDGYQVSVVQQPLTGLSADVGESTSQLATSMPGDIPNSDLKLTQDGFIFIDPNKYPTDVGTDLPAAQAEYMAHSQMPVAAVAFDASVTVAAWHDKPSYGIVATDDRALSPQLAHWMYKRSGAKVTEIKANHLVYVSQPRRVAGVIEAAARSAAENGARVP